MAWGPNQGKPVLPVTAEQISRRPGRPRSIPTELFGPIMGLYRAGLGTRAITRELERMGTLVSRSSVQRFIKGKGCYGQRSAMVSGP